jgi:pilus assembly protein CpaB
MRALSLKGDNLFDGLLRPGDRVDVLFTTHEGAEPSTATLLQNIMVLSVGGIIDRANSTSSRGLASSAVLSVSLEQSQLLTQALEHGTLALVLRNPDDILIAKNTPTANAHDVLPTAGSAKSQTSIKAAESKPAEVVRAR